MNMVQAHARPNTILTQARNALRAEPRINPHRTPVDISFENGVLTVEGELDDIAAKKLALERLAAVPGVVGIIDRLHVRPAQHMGDGAIRNHVRDALLQEPALANIALREVIKGKNSTVRQPRENTAGDITVRVDDGVVTLDGDVPGLAQKRLAGVLAWWVPGSRDVINGLGVTPLEQDSDDEITEAVRVALEKDPFVDASRIRVHTSKCVVELDGLVPGDKEREMAEYDAWYVFGVDRVVNRIHVRP
jgi:osmotically-inducible protein OsmY